MKINSDFTVACDSLQMTLSGWGTGGRNLETNPITHDEVITEIRYLLKIGYMLSFRDLRDMIRIFSPIFL